MTEAPGHPEVLRVVAPNPGPMTGAGTNTYLYGSDPCVAIDPGPDDAGHLDAIRVAAEERGGIEKILLTHSHGDHADGAERLAALAAQDGGGSGVPVVLPGDGEEHGGLRAFATPGHAADHVCLIAGSVCFSGDLILGEGSTFVPPDGGSLAAYMASLRRLQAEPIELIAPGHGPWVTDPAAKIAEYVEHREMRRPRPRRALSRGAACRGLGRRSGGAAAGGGDGDGGSPAEAGRRGAAARGPRLRAWPSGAMTLSSVTTRVDVELA
jgi:glyoxylase-like metal-dependent hydrolase (beta-lactamase superfamily II)